MGNGDVVTGAFPSIPTEELTPLPGRGASDPRFNRLAAQQERLGKFEADWQNSRGLGGRGTGDYAIILTGQRLAAQARSLDELARRVRREFSSHLLQDNRNLDEENARNAEKLAQVAFSTFAKDRRFADSDVPWMMTQAIAKEFRQLQLERRRETVGRIAQRLEKDPFLRERLAWQERINAYVVESGLDYDFVQEFVKEYDRLSQPRFPGTIDPRGIPVFVAGAGLYGVAHMFKTYLYPFTPVGPVIDVIEAVSGKDILSGRELETWERVLAGASVLLQFLGKGKPIRPGRLPLNAIGEAAQLGLNIARGVAQAAKQLAHFALSMALGARAMLRALGRFGRMQAEKLLALLARLRAAQRTGKALQLTDEEARLMREVDEAFRELAGSASNAVSTAKPTARAFMFLSRFQPLMLGRLLGRTLGRRGVRMTAQAAQEAEDVAASIAARLRAHWDAALPRGVQNSLDAAQRVFDELKRVRPANPNTWVRNKLYEAWRKRAMRRINADTTLVRDLKEQGGIIVGRNPQTDTITMHIRTKGPNAQRLQTHVDFDHGIVRHEDAVSEALRLNDSRLLISTIDGANLQLMTARENRNFIEALRAAQKEMTGP